MPGPYRKVFGSAQDYQDFKSRHPVYNTSADHAIREMLGTGSRVLVRFLPRVVRGQCFVTEILEPGQRSFSYDLQSLLMQPTT